MKGPITLTEALFKMHFDLVPEYGELGEFELAYVAVSELRHFKRWFGDEYGQKITVVSKAIWEDADAVQCLVWACRRQNNLQPNPDPKSGQMPDFDPGDVFVKKTQEEIDAEEAAKTPPLDRTGSPSESDTKTSGASGSTEETPTSSGGNGFPSSDTSAT